jgi:hypothetical protein
MSVTKFVGFDIVNLSVSAGISELNVQFPVNSFELPVLVAVTVAKLGVATVF